MKLNIVLLNPLIPQNTGNIIRTCVSLDANLHLIKPLGFKLDEKYLKRAALDYYRKCNKFVYESFEEFLKKVNSKNIYYYSRYGIKDYTKADYKKDEIYLVFGKETTGIDKEILKENIKSTYRIPTSENVRSLNLSNSVAIISYFASYKNNFKNLSYYEPEIYKGKNFLKNFEIDNIESEEILDD